jgi:hypothetical protein
LAHLVTAFRHREGKKRTRLEMEMCSRKINPKTGKCRNLGTFKTRAKAEKHERAVQYLKRTQWATR